MSESSSSPDVAWSLFWVAESSWSVVASWGAESLWAVAWWGAASSSVDEWSVAESLWVGVSWDAALLLFQVDVSWSSSPVAASSLVVASLVVASLVVASLVVAWLAAGSSVDVWSVGASLLFQLDVVWSSFLVVSWLSCQVVWWSLYRAAVTWLFLAVAWSWFQRAGWLS